MKKVLLLCMQEESLKERVSGSARGSLCVLMSVFRHIFEKIVLSRAWP